MANTRYEWILADLAVMCAGGATTTVYPSTMAEDVAYILSDSECHVVFAENEVVSSELDDAILRLRLRYAAALSPATNPCAAASSYPVVPLICPAKNKLRISFVSNE